MILTLLFSSNAQHSEVYVDSTGSTIADPKGDLLIHIAKERILADVLCPQSKSDNTVFSWDVNIDLELHTTVSILDYFDSPEDYPNLSTEELHFLFDWPFLNNAKAPRARRFDPDCIDAVKNLFGKRKPLRSFGHSEYESSDNTHY